MMFGKKKRFYDNKKGSKYMNFFYHCGFCGFDFDVWKPEGLKGVMIQCPNCKNFVPKENYNKSRMF